MGKAKQMLLTGGTIPVVEETTTVRRRRGTVRRGTGESGEEVLTNASEQVRLYQYIEDKYHELVFNRETAKKAFETMFADPSLFNLLKNTSESAQDNFINYVQSVDAPSNLRELKRSTITLASGEERAGKMITEDIMVMPVVIYGKDYVQFRDKKTGRIISYEKVWRSV